MSQPQKISVRGCEVNYLRKGKGAPLVFLHGARGGGVWMPFMEKLSERFDVIAPEHPGFGASDDPDWLDSMADLAFFYLDFLETLDLRGAHIVGNSFGGWLAFEIAIRNTGRISTLGLLAPAGIYLDQYPPPDIFLWPPEKLARNLFVDQKLIDFTINQQLTPEQQKAQLKNQITLAKLAWNPRFHNPDLVKWLHRIDVPVQLIWGREDRLNDVAYAAEYEKLLSDVRTVVIPDCGHLPHIEKLDAFLSAYLPFVQEYQS